MSLWWFLGLGGGSAAPEELDQMVGVYMDDPAMVVLAYNRPLLLARTLESLSATKGISRFKLYVSQHGNKSDVEQVIRAHPAFTRLHLERRTVRRDATVHIAQHYRFVLETLFTKRAHSHVVLVEDDMIFSPDFALYFEQLAPLLDQDPSLWCISSWNDNGFEHLVEDSSRLFRTDYFPGLGWMLTRRLWDELREHWPLDHWDHWLRHSGVSRGRECVAPEVSRNYNIGASGSNLDEDMFERYFKRMKLNQEIVLFTGTDRLLLPNYQRWMQSLFDAAEVVKSPRVKVSDSQPDDRVLLLPYVRESYSTIATTLALWDVPTRGMHNHSLVLRYKKNTLILADRRHCAYLPESERVRPHAELRVVASAVGEDCHSACGLQGMRCHQADLAFVSDCAALMSRFPCRRGMCEGPEKPVFLNDTGQCLVGEGFASCVDKYKGGQRLCPCVTIPRPTSPATHTQ